MNRLLLRAHPTTEHLTRVEVLFRYVQYLQTPMTFDGLVILDVTGGEAGMPKYASLLRKYPECRIYRLESEGEAPGEVVAAACVFGEDSASLGAE